nr:siderophore-interacting protein [uncultured Shinella sp.]
MTPTPPYEAIVLSSERLGRSMQRLTLGRGNLASFETTDIPDEFVWLSFPTTADADEKGRYYTIRRWDVQKHELLVDFVLHADGIGTDWARQAKPGDAIRFYQPRARYSPPADRDWTLLLCDLAGLPAAMRIVEEETAKSPIILHAEIPHAGDRQTLLSPAHVSLTWHEKPDPHASPTRLAEIATSINLPSAPGYIWIAGEATAAAASRRHFRENMGIPKERITAIGYWIAGQVRG